MLHLHIKDKFITRAIILVVSHKILLNEMQLSNHDFAILFVNGIVLLKTILICIDRENCQVRVLE